MNDEETPIVRIAIALERIAEIMGNIIATPVVHSMDPEAVAAMHNSLLSLQENT